MTEKEKKQTEKMLKEARNYFGDEEPIYIFKCTRCKKMDPVPGFVVGEQMGFLKFLGKRKRTVTMECPYCNGKMLPIEQFE